MHLNSHSRGAHMAHGHQSLVLAPPVALGFSGSLRSTGAGGNPPPSRRRAVGRQPKAATAATKEYNSSYQQWPPSQA